MLVSISLQIFLLHFFLLSFFLMAREVFESHRVDEKLMRTSSSIWITSDPTKHLPAGPQREEDSEVTWQASPIFDIYDPIILTWVP